METIEDRHEEKRDHSGGHGGEQVAPSTEYAAQDNAASGGGVCEVVGNAVRGTQIEDPTRYPNNRRKRKENVVWPSIHRSTMAKTRARWKSRKTKSEFC
jgi:hypothetical protein